MSAMQNYKIQLDTYSGPMDLLLYLIRRDEVDVYDIPIARILGQYIEYIRLLEMLDPDAVGDFLVMAATLMEIKSRMLLPKPPPEEMDDEEFDPRADLVRQLLAYRAFREAADRLKGCKDQHSRRFGRPRMDVPQDDDQEVDIEDAQIWDLLTAFNKLLASVGQRRTTHDVVYDDTPITLHATDILDRLERDGPAMAFEEIFEGRTRSEMIGLFLALLELIRQARVRVDQSQTLGKIMVHLLDATPITELAVTESDEEDGEDAFADAPFEEEAEGAEEESQAVFVDEDLWDDQDEDDEFSQRIKAVEIGEVDLGRSLSEESPPESENAADQAEDSAESKEESIEAGSSEVEGESP